MTSFSVPDEFRCSSVGVSSWTSRHRAGGAVTGRSGSHLARCSAATARPLDSAPTPADFHTTLVGWYPALCTAAVRHAGSGTSW